MFIVIKFSLSDLRSVTGTLMTKSVCNLSDAIHKQETHGKNVMTGGEDRDRLDDLGLEGNMVE